MKSKEFHSQPYQGHVTFWGTQEILAELIWARNPTPNLTRFRAQQKFYMTKPSKHFGENLRKHPEMGAIIGGRKKKYWKSISHFLRRFGNSKRLATSANILASLA